MKQAELCRPYVNKRGKLVTGTAAFLNYVFTKKGGIQEYNDEVGAEYISAFIKAHSETINSEMIAKHNRRQFKVVS